jgi:hypothetical protein
MKKEIKNFFEAHKEYYNARPIYKDIIDAIGNKTVSMPNLSIKLCKQGHLNQDKKYEDGDMKIAVWHLVGANILHFDNDYNIRLKRKTDWMIED